jgi:hypothetical protein
MNQTKNIERFALDEKTRQMEKMVDRAAHYLACPPIVEGVMSTGDGVQLWSLHNELSSPPSAISMSNNHTNC